MLWPVGLLLLQVIQQEYTSNGATIGPDLPVEFEYDSISLQLPSEEDILDGGWKIFPLIHPMVGEPKVVSAFLLFKSLYLNLQITKKEVDSFNQGRRIPSCQLTAEWTKPSKPSRLVHKVTLKGAKGPSNYFRIVLDSNSVSVDTTESGELLV